MAPRTRIAPDDSPHAPEVPLRTLLTCLLAVVLAWSTRASGAPSGPAGPVAVIASSKGRVEVSGAHGGGAVAATFGRALERGDKVVVGAGASVTLFFNDGNVVVLDERSSLTIGGRATGSPPVPARGSALGSEVFANVSHFVTAGSRQTGLVTMADMRSDADAGAPLLLSPRNTSVLDDAPTLRWRAVAGATRYRVHFGPAAGAEAWTREVAATPGVEPALEFPADAARLKAGEESEWEVEVLDEKGTLRREAARVRVLPAESGAAVRANLASLTESAGGEKAAATRFLAGSYLSGLGLYDEAARQFQALVPLAPESPAPHEALGNVYLRVGLTDRAATEFQQALALRRDAR